jgi:hypothetical protein
MPSDTENLHDRRRLRLGPVSPRFSICFWPILTRSQIVRLGATGEYFDAKAMSIGQGWSSSSFGIGS